MAWKQFHFPKWVRENPTTEPNCEVDEESPFIKDEIFPDSKSSAGRQSHEEAISKPNLPWFLVALLSLFIIISRISPSDTKQESNTLSSTDFIPAQTAISKTQIKFSSSLDFVDSENIYRIYDDDDPVYVGNTSAAIDRAWDELILPADIYITEKEAMNVGGELYQNPETGKYKIELEVFHSLHCLNMIRMRVYGDAYPHMQTHKAKIHVDHCIESLRELIMCGGDMTPIPLEWSESGQRLNPNYATSHSCRDFSKLKDWMVLRSKGGV